MKLSKYDIILLNTSGGKDSQAMIEHVYKLAQEQGFLDRLVLVHSILTGVEWPGTLELVEEHAQHYALPLETVHRPQGGLLEHVRQRGMWPSSTARYCTSDHKRGQIMKVITKLVNAKIAAGTQRPVRVLNCLGLRAQESPARAKRQEVSRNKLASNGKREVTNWLPLHGWTEEQVWASIKSSGVRYHAAYDLGMPRLSCAFCIFAPRDALVIAGHHNPELLQQYVDLEAEIEHQFRGKPGSKGGCSMAEIQTAVKTGAVPETANNWRM